MPNTSGLGDSEQTTTDMLLICGDSWKEFHTAMRCLAEAAIAEAPTCVEVAIDKVWTVHEAELFRCADAMKEWHEYLLDDIDMRDVRGAIIGTLVQSAMSDVDWNQIADYYIQRVKENE